MRGYPHILFLRLFPFMGFCSLPRVVIMYDVLFNTGNWLDIENGVRYLAEQVDCHHWCHRNHLDSSWTKPTLTLTLLSS